MALLHPPPKDDLAAMDHYFEAVVAAEHAARLAVRAVLKGGVPDLEALENGAQVLEMLRTGLFRDDRVKLTQDDVAAARHLVDLVRRGAPKEEVVAAAQGVHKIMNRPRDPAFVRPREEIERTWLDALRQRGIEPTEEHVRDVRRLAALSVEDVEDAVEARLESEEICQRLFPPPTSSRS